MTCFRSLKVIDAITDAFYTQPHPLIHTFSTHICIHTCNCHKCCFAHIMVQAAANTHTPFAFNSQNWRYDRVCGIFPIYFVTLASPSAFVTILLHLFLFTVHCYSSKQSQTADLLLCLASGHFYVAAVTVLSAIKANYAEIIVFLQPKNFALSAFLRLLLMFFF